MLRDRLPGTWQLISLETHRADGEITWPFGPNTVGQFVFDAFGNFSVQLMNPDRAENDAAGYSAFFGTYEVDEEHRSFTLSVRGSLASKMIGKRIVRFVSFRDGLAVFTPGPQDMGGVGVKSYITWKKISS